MFICYYFEKFHAFVAITVFFSFLFSFFWQFSLQLALLRKYVCMYLEVEHDMYWDREKRQRDYIYIPISLFRDHSPLKGFYLKSI